MREDPEGAVRSLSQLAELMPPAEIAAQLESEGVRKFVEPFEALHAAIEKKRHAVIGIGDRPT